MRAGVESLLYYSSAGDLLITYKAKQEATLSPLLSSRRNAAATPLSLPAVATKLFLLTLPLTPLLGVDVAPGPRGQ